MSSLNTTTPATTYLNEEIGGIVFMDTYPVLGLPGLIQTYYTVFVRKIILNQRIAHDF